MSGPDQTSSPVPGGFSARVPDLLDGVRVDRVVAMLADCSRSRAASLLEEGKVTLDGAPPASVSAGVRAGQLLAIEPEDSPPLLRADPTVPFDLVYHDTHLAVVDKPPGVVVHPGAGHEGGTLVGGLLARFPELADLPAAGAGDPDRPGIVHRLDRDTSGLLVVARTPEAYHALVAQLAQRSVERRYLARVHGHLADARGLIDAPLKRSVRTPTLMTVSASGREARTRYRVIERAGDARTETTLLEVSLETGRTHQIRVHLAAIGHPVLGDVLYGRERVGDASRLMLHATQLSLDHPADGGRRRWRSAPPPELSPAAAP